MKITDMDIGIDHDCTGKNGANEYWLTLFINGSLSRIQAEEIKKQILDNEKHKESERYGTHREDNKSR